MLDKMNSMTAGSAGAIAPISEPQRSRSALIFISHDTRDAQIAEAFSRLLSSVSAGVLKSFRSSDKKGSQGIEYGVEWYPEIMKKLETASDVVCLLTFNSVNRPWILYEAGVAKGKLDTPVHGIVLGIELQNASTGPFAQFQNCDDTDDSLTSLVMQLVKRIPNAEPDREVVRAQVQSFKQKIASFLQPETPQFEDEAKVEEPSTAKLFEEIKIMYQDLPMRIERRMNPEARNFIRSRRRFHPALIDELIHNLDLKRNDPLRLLILTSLVKDELPWLYEIAADYSRALFERNSRRANEARDRLMRAVAMLRQGPFLEIIRDKDVMRYVQEFSHYIEVFLIEEPEFTITKPNT